MKQQLSFPVTEQYFFNLLVTHFIVFCVNSYKLTLTSWIILSYDLPKC